MKNTEILVITDRSGSMASIRADVNGGFDSFIDEQRKLPGDARVTHVWFDDRVETLYAATPLADVPPMDLQPRGSTALHDAIGRTLSEQGKRIADEKWADLVVVVIITDGGENASKEYNAYRVKEMIRHAESHGWKFVFLAANQDAFTTGSGLGISGQLTRNFVANAAGVNQSYAFATQSVASLRADIQTPSVAP